MRLRLLRLMVGGIAEHSRSYDHHYTSCAWEGRSHRQEDKRSRKRVLPIVASTEATPALGKLRNTWYDDFTHKDYFPCN